LRLGRAVKKGNPGGQVDANSQNNDSDNSNLTVLINILEKK